MSGVEMEPARITINGTTYLMELATIERTSLGYEDHGIFTAWLTLDYGGSAQGAGLMILDEPVKDAEGNFIRRRGTAFGHDHIIQILATVGVGTWEDVKGKRVYALKPERYGTVEGLANATDPTAKYLLFKEHAKQFHPEQN